MADLVQRLTDAASAAIANERPALEHPVGRVTDQRPRSTLLMAPLEYAGVTFRIEYDAAATSSPEIHRLIARFKEVDAEGGDWRPIYRQAVLFPIINWDLADDDGNVYPLVPESFDRMPADFDRLVMRAMTDHNRRTGRSLGVRRGPKYTPPKPKRKKRR